MGVSCQSVNLLVVLQNSFRTIEVRLGRICFLLLVAPGLCCGAQLTAQLNVGNVFSGTQETVPPVIAGHAVNAVTGAPLPRVLVEVGGRALLTDQEGRFRFEQPGQAVSALRVKKPGYSAFPEQMEGAGPGALEEGAADSLTVLLWPEGLLTGTVMGTDAEPLPHILVMARRSMFDEQGHHFQVAAQTQTDSRGQFRLPVLAGDYVVETQFSQRGFEREDAILPCRFPASSTGASEEVLHLLSGEERRIELRPVVSKTHMVTIPLDQGDEGQTPRISVRSKDGLTFSAGGSHPQEPGSVHLNLPSGSYSLRAMRFFQGGVQFGESSIAVGSQDVTGSVLHLASVPNIPIEVVGESGGQALASSAGVRPNDAVPNLMQFNPVLEPLETDPNSPFQFGIRPTQGRDGTASFAAPPGSYRLRAGLASGWYVRSATSRGSDLARETLVISPGASTSPIVLTVSKDSGSVQGVITASGSPSASWIYLIANRPSLPQVVTGRSDAAGAFHIADLPPGSYRAVAFPYKHSADLEDPAVLERFARYLGAVTVASGSSATLDLEAVSLKELMR